jgi:hypothetical protein
VHPRAGAAVHQACGGGSVGFAVTVTPDGDQDRSGDAGDHSDGEVTGGGCAAGGGAGSLAFAPVLMVLRRRRR